MLAASLFQTFFHWPSGAVWGNVIAVPLCAALTWPVVWRKKMCRTPWCWHFGKHEVAGTTWKVCDDHHNKETHSLVFYLHRTKHPERMGWGDSHDENV